jgi:hypothetical protein
MEDPAGGGEGDGDGDGEGEVFDAASMEMTSSSGSPLQSDVIVHQTPLQNMMQRNKECEFKEVKMVQCHVMS